MAMPSGSGPLLSLRVSNELFASLLELKNAGCVSAVLITCNDLFPVVPYPVFDTCVGESETGKIRPILGTEKA